MNNIIKKNTKIWNNIFEKKRFAPCFPTSNIQVFVKHHLPNKNKSSFKILDVGFGNGANFRYLKDLGFSVYGIDSTKWAVNLQKKYFNKHEYKKRIKLNSFEKIQFKDNFFDAVIADGVLYYANIYQLKNGINEIYRVLKRKSQARIYIKTKSDAIYKKSKTKKASLLIKKNGWERGLTLSFLSEKQVKLFFNKFKKIKMGIDEFNYINHKEKHSFWVITATK
jgi:ubiquinone/menaquinone biosynthesis C-methylase UbiE|tara:strand:+ start:358 stop:1026 length:669 start_codon:yes stop_codon:yes gene_type:complete